MSAPAEALGKFWTELREKSRVRIEHPDLPDDLRTAAGELTAALWSKAQAHAQEGLAVLRNEADAAVLEAKADQAAAEADRDKARDEAAATQASLTAATETIRNVEQQLAAQGATRAALELQLHQAGQDSERLQAALDEARREFTAELDKHRSGAQLGEERLQAAEERALREIDRERTVAAKLQKEVDLVRAAASQAADALHTEIGQLRQKVGVLEGNLQAAQSERNRISADAEALRQQITEAASQAAGYRSDAENWHRRADELQVSLAAFQAKTAKRSRRSNPGQTEETSL